ncbi:MAG: TerD family protein [Rhodospirillales bacterium]|nr:TerD family protein [Rhodospirillales bacterium]
MNQEARGSVKLDLSKSISGRVYVGLSWDNAYHPGSKLGKGSQFFLKLEDIPKTEILILSFIFLFFYSWGLFLAFDSIRLLFLALPLAIGTAVFLSLFLSRLEGPFFSKKEKDLPGRDEDFSHFDIDLHCFAYDINRNFLFEISPETRKLISPDGKIYHSGEEETGIGVYDDETIHIELKKLPDLYSFFVFSVSNDCRHSFNKISNLKVRLVDSASEQTLLETLVSSDQADGFAFCTLYKNDGEWFFSPIAQYLKFDGEWKTSLTQFLEDYHITGSAILSQTPKA